MQAASSAKYFPSLDTEMGQGENNPDQQAQRQHNGECHAVQPREQDDQQHHACHHADAHQYPSAQRGCGVVAERVRLPDRQRSLRRCARALDPLDNLADKLRVGMDHIRVTGQAAQEQAHVAHADIALARRPHKALNRGRLVHQAHFIVADRVDTNGPVRRPDATGRHRRTSC